MRNPSRGSVHVVEPESSYRNHGDIRCIRSRCIAAILDSTRNIIILTADERVFELPVGFSERLHARIDLELGEDEGD